MYALKFAHLLKEKTDAEVFQFYIDMRTFGKGYEEFYDRLLDEGVFFIRGRGAEVTNVAERPEEEGKLIVCCEDTLIGAYRRVPVDMVVLATGLEPRADVEEVRRTFGIGCGAEGFFQEKHAKLAPVSTTTDGVFLAGACQGPKDIPDAVAQGSAAASQALALMDKGLVEIEPITAVINEDVCCGCKICIGLCPYTAISFDEEKSVSVVNDVLCKGCGTCVAACTTGAANQRHFKSEQLLAEIEGVLS
jgi:heterodisulfide reductase subunit A